MKRLVFGEDAQIAAWMTERIGTDFKDDLYKAIGIADNSGLICGVLYNGYIAGVGINMHVAAIPGRKWAYPHFLRAFFTYPFIQLSLRRVTGLVPAKNKAALKFDLHLGFKYEGTIRNGLIDDDLVVLGMLKEECRYLVGEHGITDPL